MNKDFKYQAIEFLDNEERSEYTLIQRMKVASYEHSRRLIEGYKQMSIKHLQKHFGTDPAMIPERKHNYDGCWDGSD